MERTMIYTIEDERKPLDSEQVVLEIDPYGGNRVNKQYPKLIEKAAKESDNLLAHFPLEPFHYREVKRHGTQLAMEACVENNVPMSLETQKEVPMWAVELLTRHKMSEIRIGMNTFDKKKWKAINPMASEPTTLRDSFIHCFNAGIYSIVSIPDVVPGVITKFDIFHVVDTFKYWAKGVEIHSKSFEESEFEEARSAFKSKKLGDISDYYIKEDGRYIVEPNYWNALVNKLDYFLVGIKLPLIAK